MPIYVTRPEYVEAMLLLEETASAIERWTHGHLIRYREDGKLMGIEITVGEDESGPIKIYGSVNMYVVRDQIGHWNFMTVNQFIGRYHKL
jgi:hypothetical protein